MSLCLFSCGGESADTSNTLEQYNIEIIITPESNINKVNIQPLDIQCSSSCTYQVDANESVTLTPLSHSNYQFSFWEGPCNSTRNERCVLTMDSSKTIFANFEAKEASAAVAILIEGNGTITTNTGLTCADLCDFSIPLGESVTITAQETTASQFSGWGYAPCNDQRLTCTITPTTNIQLNPSFKATEEVAITLTIVGQGSIETLNNGSTCTESCITTIGLGDKINLQAKPANGYSFSTWSNNCDNSSSLCSAIVNSPTSFIATFVPTSFNRKINSMLITEPIGVDRINHPVQFARPFEKGEITDFPEVVIDGHTFAQQVNVKQRHDDGSVKHAIFNIILTSLPAYSSAVVNFKNKLSSDNTGLTKNQMLDDKFNFDTKMKFTFNESITVSARDMVTTDKYTYWLQGPVATSILVLDHSANRRYDVGNDSHRSIRPMFNITFWPTINEYTVRYVAENANTETLQDQSYDISLTLGHNDKLLYEKLNVPHQAMTRWTKQFHSTNYLNNPLSIDHNVQYLVRTKSLPNYDYNRIVPESQIAQDWALWQNKSTDIYDTGLWQPAMAAAGGRPDIGLYPSWAVKWVFTGDWRHQEIAFKQAELAASWPIHLREGDSGRFFDFQSNTPAIGRIISLAPDARPTHWTSRPNWHEVNDNDKIAFLSPQTNSIWRPDTAHHPDLSNLQYLLSGDYFFLEQMKFSAAFVTGDSNAKAFKYSYGRGPTGSAGAMYSRPARGQAWHLRTRLHTVDILPDNTPEKDYFDHILKNGIALWEGKYQLSNSYPDRADLYQFAFDTISKNAFVPADGPSPLGEWESGIVSGSYVNSQFVNTDTVNQAAAPWMRNFLISALGRARELGYKTDNLLEFASKPIREPFAIDNFKASILAAYVIPTLNNNNTWFTDWATTLSQYQADYVNETATRLASGADSEHGYYSIAMAAAAYSYHLPEGKKMWQYFNDNVRSKAIYDLNPKWAILPR
jgi:Divergent InlB B-repeat domain